MEMQNRQQRDDILLAKIKTTLKTLNVGKNGPSNSQFVADGKVTLYKHL